MSRLPRSALPDGYFHVFARGVAGTDAPFPDDEDKTTMLDLLMTLEWREQLRLHVACVMSTHYHAVVEGMVDALSAGMHWANWAYARYHNEKYELFGHVFAERFRARIPRDEDGLARMCTYVLQNPPRAGLCERSEDWPWSFSRYGSGAC